MPPTIGGISSYVNNLSDRLVDIGYKTKVLDVVKKKHFYKKAINASNPGFLIFYFLKLYFSGYRVFHFNSSQKSFPLVVLFPFLFLPGVKSICSIHSGSYIEWLFASKRRSNFYKFIFRFLDSLIFMNASQAKIISEKCSLKNVDSVSSFLVSDPKWYSTKRAYKLDYICKVSTMGLWQTYYSYEDVIQACEELATEEGISFAVDLVIGSSHPDIAFKNKLTSMVEDEKRKISVKIRHDEKDVLTYLSNRDIFIRSSSIDSYGLCVAESLLVGTPVIATNVCKRAENTIVYTHNNIPELKSKIMIVLKELRVKTKKICLLPKEEDSFNNILEHY